MASGTQRRRHIVVVGTSTGGIAALKRLVADLPTGLPAAVLIVTHMSSDGGLLSRILARAGPLPVAEAVDGKPIENGHVYVAVPDRHLLVDDGRMVLRRRPRENAARPEIDRLFRTAAAAYGAQVIGVVLTGLLNDGSAGLRAIKRCGGLAVVQDPKDAEAPSMPRSALRYVEVDHCVPVSEM